MEYKLHLTTDGLEEIKKIKSGMNTGRNPSSAPLLLSLWGPAGRDGSARSALMSLRLFFKNLRDGLRFLLFSSLRKLNYKFKEI
jgi:hypothetical protein